MKKIRVKVTAQFRYKSTATSRFTVICLLSSVPQKLKVALIVWHYVKSPTDNSSPDNSSPPDNLSPDNLTPVYLLRQLAPCVYTQPNLTQPNQVIWSYVFYDLTGGQAPQTPLFIPHWDLGLADDRRR